MSMYEITFFFMYFSSILVFTMKCKHLLVMLLGLESSVVSIYVGLFYMLNMMDYEFLLSMLFLAMSVCEGALGLSLLVLMIRVHGNDFIMTFNSLW
uniref:NADH-ubiquinone oxidoreductase chain 4L n=1 Tax=Myllocerinus aurolineatus TaxID=2527849 RepID=A0A411LVT9_9CUCU|nr:NADH dehydrogenase subunit 4L [Myllocerinus aurolineatus]QBF03600.1 NADH dehydrogenase subunit 4L [Myllocerinus aurolineatus]